MRPPCAATLAAMAVAATIGVSPNLRSILAFGGLTAAIALGICGFVDKWWVHPGTAVKRLPGFYPALATCVVMIFGIPAVQAYRHVQMSSNTGVPHPPAMQLEGEYLPLGGRPFQLWKPFDWQLGSSVHGIDLVIESPGGELAVAASP